MLLKRWHQWLDMICITYRKMSAIRVLGGSSGLYSFFVYEDLGTLVWLLTVDGKSGLRTFHAVSRQWEIPPHPPSTHSASRSRRRNTPLQQVLAHVLQLKNPTSIAEQFAIPNMRYSTISIRFRSAKQFSLMFANTNTLKIRSFDKDYTHYQNLYDIS